MKLTVEELSILLPLLRRDFPASLNVYYLARNIVLQKFAWPGLEFFADSFPNASVCIIRTAPSSRKDVPPFFNGYAVFVYSKDPRKLAQLISEEGVIDWTETISFCMIHEPGDLFILKEKCRELGGTATVTPGSSLYESHAVFAHFDLDKISAFDYTLPAGFRLGSLAVEHTQRITQNKSYGNPETNRLFFRYVFQAGYPSAAIFTDDNKLVAYVLQRPENCLGVGFVAEGYRSRGFFKIVCFELLKKMKQNGETETYADVSFDNTHSRNTMVRLGGTFYPDEFFEWFEFVPSDQGKACCQ